LLVAEILPNFGVGFFSISRFITLVFSSFMRSSGTVSTSFSCFEDTFFYTFDFPSETEP